MKGMTASVEIQGSQPGCDSRLWKAGIPGVLRVWNRTRKHAVEKSSRKVRNFEGARSRNWKACSGSCCMWKRWREMKSRRGSREILWSNPWKPGGKILVVLWREEKFYKRSTLSNRLREGSPRKTLKFSRKTKNKKGAVKPNRPLQGDFKNSKKTFNPMKDWMLI